MGHLLDRLDLLDLEEVFRREVLVARVVEVELVGISRFFLVAVWDTD